LALSRISSCFADSSAGSIIAEGQFIALDRRLAGVVAVLCAMAGSSAHCSANLRHFLADSFRNPMPSTPMNVERAIELQEQAWSFQAEGKLDDAQLTCREDLRLMEESEGPAVGRRRSAHHARRGRVRGCS